MYYQWELRTTREQYTIFGVLLTDGTKCSQMHSSSLLQLFKANSVVSLPESVHILSKTWGITFVSATKMQGPATGNLCQKAQIAKSWKSFLQNLTQLAEHIERQFFSLKKCHLRIHVEVTENFNAIFAWQLDFISGAVDPGEHGRCGGCRGGNLLRKAWGSGNRGNVLGLRHQNIFI